MNKKKPVDYCQMIAECTWRKEVWDIDICRLACEPCGRCIEKGQCVMFKEYFGKEQK